ncbi:MAG TPA: hypothetical protein VLF61_02735 [Rhabdochlamydiaceae bacterium]|nr:hypothetical protein [Rhabdochlamydiaceae bacterium]
MIFFSKSPKIQLFVRHCYFSSASHKKERPKHFDRYKCHQNLLQTIDKKRVEITFFLDSFYKEEEPHFVLEQTEYPVVEIKEGTEAGSFLRLTDYALSQKYDAETILYFLEDDYLHKEGWVNILQEGFTLPGIDYVTLYDHKDKYFLPSYTHLESKIFHTESCHWRTTPSTTNTFAMRFKTLLKHQEIQRAFSKERKISADHEKFCALKEAGATLISSIPGWATHAEPAYASPCFNWEKLLHKSTF